MSGLFQRVIGWLANKVLVQTLAENRSFQRLVLRIDDTLQKVKKDGVDKALGVDKMGGDKAVERLTKSINEAGVKAGRFSEQFVKEIEKDLGRFNKK